MAGDWSVNVGCFGCQAHDLEQERKVSEQLSEQLRQHLASFERQFDQIRDQVQTPSPQQVATPTTEQQQQQQQQENENKNCHDETMEKELSDIRAQLEEAKRKYIMSCRNEKSKQVTDLVAEWLVSWVVTREVMSSTLGPVA